MRTDLTQAFIDAKNSSSSSPRTLCIFNFPESGIVRVSDIEVTVGNDTYEALVSDWGTLEDAADPETESAEVRQQTITIINSGDNPFSDYFLTDSPENVEVELYQWFDGLDETDLALIDRLVVQDPIEFDENTQTLSLDLVSLNMRYDNFAGPLLTKESYPTALEDSIGKRFNYLVGSPGQVKTVNTSSALKATLDGPIVAKSTIISVRENIANWPPTGNFFIGEEEITYGSRSASSFNVTNRGVGSSKAADHADGEEVYQKENHVFAICWNPTASVSDVRVDGVAPPADTYSIEPTLPATIKFNTRPYSIQHSRTSVIEPVEFDSKTGDNTAIKAHYAFDGKDSTSAVINKSARTLAIKQVDTPDDIGHIAKVFLTVKHWASNVYLNDQAKVFLTSNLLGALDRPLDGDNITVAGEVDIDHGHDHKTGDRHTHTHDDASYSAAVGLHEHALDGGATEIEVPPSGIAFPYLQNEYSGFTDIILTHSWIPPGGRINTSYIKVVAFIQGVGLEVLEGGFSSRAYWPPSLGGTSINQQVVLGTSISLPIYLRVHGAGVVGGYARISGATLFITYAEDIEPSRSDVTPFLSETGSNRNAFNTNNVDDVDPFADANRTLELTTKSPTKFIETKFDVTELYPANTLFNWDWFTNQTLKIIYNGSADNVDLLITNVQFDVAIRKRERVYSDDVTCSPTASTLNRPNTVIRELLEDRAGLPSEYIDSPSFQAAGQKYVQYGYFLNGVIDGSVTVKEQLKNILKQCRSRLIWSGGKVKLVFRDSFEDWEINKDLLPADFQLKSIAARRQKIADLVNKLSVKYLKNWAEDNYAAMVTKQDLESVNLLGEIPNSEDWNFDLVTSESMAEDLAEYYLTLLSTPSTFYTFNSYLSQFELEKEDKLRLTSSGFNQMVKLPVYIRAANRVFGSYEAGQINLIQVIAESLRFIKRSLSLEENVSVDESISVIIGLILDFQELSSCSEELAFSIDSTFDESVSPSESLLVVAAYAPDLDETITLSEAASFELLMNLSDTVFATDAINFQRLIGYGSGGYGIEAGYGGVIDLGQRNSESMFPEEQISFDIDSALADTATAGDSISFSDGYGSPVIGDGYGFTPYGI